MMLLHQLHPRPSPHALGARGIQVDVVLVHGLRGNHTKTWQAEDGTVWPGDLLPKHLKDINIRVLSFEYGGSIKGTSSEAGIDDTARALLNRLIDKRDGPGIDWRPLVFVGHSLGGVVIKRAIRVAYNEPMFRSIKNTTLGVMFFATPHHGGKKEFLSFLSDVLECNGPTEPWPIRMLIRPTEDMKKEIQQYPMLLTYISNDFVPLCSKLSFKVFLEGQITESLGREVLKRGQAVMYHNAVEGSATMINGDHLSVCKCGSEDAEETFSVVWKGMKEIIENSPRRRKLLARHRETLDMLCSETLCQSMMTKKPRDNTGEWIFELEEFKDWSHEKSEKSRLWISGKPGCGKSYLAKHIVDKLSEQGKTVISAFLCKPDQTNIDAQCLLFGIIQHALDVEPELYRDQQTPAGSDVKDLLIKVRSLLQAIGPQRMTRPRENNVQGLLAATVRQVLDMKPDLVDTLLVPYLESRVLDGDIGTLNDLEALWVDVMTDKSVRHPIIAVIDGFDKMERKCQEAFFDTLAKLRAKSQAAHSVRLLLFSTEYKHLDSDLTGYEFMRYDIQIKDVTADITMVVNSHLGVVQKVYNYPSELQKQVPKAANGIYLWADLMLGVLKRTRYSKGDLQELLGSPPNSSAALYDHLFGRIWAKEATSRSVKQVLSWVVFRLGELNPAELAIARALGEARDNAHGRDISYEQVCQFLDKNTELWVNRFCGHLVKLEDGCFRLVHPSLAEYLTTEHDLLHEGYKDNVELPYHAEFYMDAAETHARLGNLCATYLAMPFFARSVWSERKNWVDWQAAVKERMKEHKFLRYAALHWSVHLKLARDLAVPGGRIKEATTDRARRLKLEKNAESWTEVGCYFHDWHEQEACFKLCQVDEQIIHKSPLPRVTDVRKGGKSNAPEPAGPSPLPEHPSANLPQENAPPQENVPPQENAPPRENAPLQENVPLQATHPTPPPRETSPHATNAQNVTITRVARVVYATPPPRRNHWLVRGAQKLVTGLRLEKKEGPAATRMTSTMLPERLHHEPEISSS